MSDSKTNANAPQGLKEQRERRARVNRIKTGIILILILLLTACIVVDIVLVLRVSSLQEQIDILAEKVIESMSVPESDTSDTENMQENAADSSEKVDQTSTDTSNPSVREALSTEDNLRGEDDPMNVYLTFDDGPSENTPEILEVLKEHNVKATFFVTGKEGEEAAQWYQQIVADGHTLGMHSYSHKYSELYASLDSFKADFTKLQDLIFDVTGETCWVYRFPGGSSNQVSNTDMNEFIDYLGEQGMTYYDWNVVSGDATSQNYTAEDLVDHVLTDVVKYKNSVVLMHDAADKDSTVEALEIILQRLEQMDATILPITKDSPVIHHHLSE